MAADYNTPRLLKAWRAALQEARHSDLAIRVEARQFLARLGAARMQRCAAVPCQ
jgi:hypothetical protein